MFKITSFLIIGAKYSDFFPVVLRFIRPLPVIRNVLAFPVIKPYIDDYIDGGKLPV